MDALFDPVFRALSHPDRRQILDFVRDNPGANVNDVSSEFSSSRIAVMKHIRKLEAATLIVSEKEGRVRRLYFNLIPIQMIYDRWTDEYSALWAERITKFKDKLEARSKSRTRKKQA